MGSLNYIIATQAMTLTDRKEYSMKALAAALERAYIKAVGDLASDIPSLRNMASPEERTGAILGYLRGGHWPKSLDAREMQPILDFGCALDQWNTAALAVVGTPYSALQAVAAPALAQNNVAVFYKVGVETTPMPVSRLIFRTGGAAGNVIGLFDLEQVVSYQINEGFFTEPVVIDPTTTFAAQVLCRIATGVFARVQLGGWIIEPQGTTIA